MDDLAKKRYLITKGEWPKSAGGGKASLKEKIAFLIICIVIAIFVFILLRVF